MPCGDGTGPRGMGPGSGRGMGPCGRGMRRGYGFGCGYGGRGRGIGIMPSQQTPEEERASLQQMKENLENGLKQIQKRLEELK